MIGERCNMHIEIKEQRKPKARGIIPSNFKNIVTVHSELSPLINYH